MPIIPHILSFYKQLSFVVIPFKQPEQSPDYGISRRVKSSHEPNMEGKSHGKEQAVSSGGIHKRVFHRGKMPGVYGKFAVGRRICLPEMRLPPRLPAIQWSLSMCRMQQATLSDSGMKPISCAGLSSLMMCTLAGQLLAKNGAGIQKRRKFLWLCLWMSVESPLCQAKMRVTQKIKRVCVKKFAQAAFAQDSTIHSDGYRSYIPALKDNTHEHKPYGPNSGLLPFQPP